MSILEGAGIHHIVYAVEDFAPLAFVLLHTHRLFLGKCRAGSGYSFLAVYPRGDKGRKAARHILALLSHCMERVDSAFGRAANFATDIPAAEAWVFAAIALPHFVDYILVVLYLPAHVAGIPVAAGVIEAEPELHAVLVGKTQIHIKQVGVRHIAAAFAGKILRRISDKLPIAGAYHYHGIDTHALHVGEIGIPLGLAPILVRNVVRYFVEEGAGDRQSGAARRHCRRCRSFGSLGTLAAGSGQRAQSPRHSQSRCSDCHFFKETSSVFHFLNIVSCLR